MYRCPFGGISGLQHKPRCIVLGRCAIPVNHFTDFCLSAKNKGTDIAPIHFHRNFSKAFMDDVFRDLRQLHPAVHFVGFLAACHKQVYGKIVAKW